ncbi:class III lanthionine synthetase LanKC [Actinomadura sp. ATCC 31491]|uniref:Class III lanthionine synthetase LanKC n=1 Tax=Actinomadura luzonensis TaxID=2805427 RepID=A0ABT0FMT5_9ACTN|nr:class III lanthionine synthetase LanKC [Actinomadura luzonensis]MCK2213640.1 class III lanthionine synthetase LanKC [Actinomadura luzonensis]
MNRDYHLFCQADPLFYDVPPAADDFPCAPLPPGWLRHDHHEWRSCLPPGPGLPAQGWKIHVSGRPDNAERLIAAVRAYCLPRGLAFKFLRGPRAVLARNAKYAPRAGSGKLLTLYPRDEAELERVCAELGGLLEGEPGPYILSDLRIAAGPLYVRYGAFVPRWCRSADGERVPAIEDPAGALVPDPRGPVFALPPWVDLPPFLAPHLAAREAVTVGALPYEIEAALHHSNGGGLYRARRRDDGEPVVLKEARPHAGFSADGSDAVTRLRHERNLLERLSGLPAVPALDGYVTLGDHEFLAMELVPGITLSTALARRHPLTAEVGRERDVAGFTRWALRTHGLVEQAVAELHRRGYVHGDLHLGNVLSRPDGSVTLIDYEAAFPVAERRRPAVAAPGFLAPPGRAGADLDRHALAVLRLALFLPMPMLLQLDRGKAAHLADLVAEHFPVPEEWLREAVAVIAPDRPPSRPRLAPDGPGRDAITRAILATATPGRADRLFPGDIAQFGPGGGLNLAHGAAGVLYALHASGAGRFPGHERWLLDRVLTGRDVRPGFYDGLHGIAYALACLGRLPEALDVLAAARRHDLTDCGHDLYGGLAGIGLNLLHFARLTARPDLREAAHLLAGRIGDDPPAQAGLMHGASGPALLFLALYEDRGDPAYLDRAATALRHDLGRCVTDDDGLLQVDEGWRLMPYLAGGSIGIGLVLRRYLRHRHDARFARALAGIRRVARSGFFVQPGLFSGRAGAVLALADDPEHGPEQARRLAWHALPHRGGLAFPGEQLLRLSADLATGAAGVLLALAAAQHRRPASLPFLDERR